jgi:hypothetical protein
MKIHLPYPIRIKFDNKGINSFLLVNLAGIFGHWQDFFS